MAQAHSTYLYSAGLLVVWAKQNCATCDAISSEIFKSRLFCLRSLLHRRRRVLRSRRKDRVLLAFLVAEEIAWEVPGCMPEDARGGGRDGAPQERVGLGNHC